MNIKTVIINNIIKIQSIFPTNNILQYPTRQQHPYNNSYTHILQQKIKSRVLGPNVLKIPRPYHSSFPFFSQDSFPTPLEVLKLEYPGIINRKVLTGVPG